MSSSGTFPGKGGQVERPANLILRPRLWKSPGDRRVLLMARSLEEGLMAAGGTVLKCAGSQGDVFLISLDENERLFERALRKLSGAGVDSARYERLMAGNAEAIRSLLADFAPEVVMIPSPVEDMTAFLSFSKLLVDDSRPAEPEEVFLYELRSPVLPNLVVDVTPFIPIKEGLSEDGKMLDLSMALNQYRSVTNMRGRGFTEAFFSVSAEELRSGGSAGWTSMGCLDNTPIPFFRGYELLDDENVEWFGDEEESGSVLILSPHYDDESIGCAGTILRHLRRGDDVAVVFMTDGSEGDPREDDREQVSAMRMREAMEAASGLGVERLEFLEEPETMLKPSREVIARLGKIIEDAVPDVIYLPSFLDNHVDHMELSRILYSVLKGGESGPEIRFFGLWTMIPANFLVDVSDVYEDKIKTVNRYRSQITQVDYLSAIMSMNRYWSARYGDGKGYLEIFYSVEASGYCSLIEALGLEREMFR